jgi:hypothetical protein
MRTNTGKRGRLRARAFLISSSRIDSAPEAQTINRKVQAMTLKANANQQSTVTFFRSGRRAGGRAAVAAPALRRISRHPEHLLADAILDLAIDDVNLNIGAAAADLSGVTAKVNLTAAPFTTGVEAFLEPRKERGIRMAAAGLDDEDEDEDDDFDDDDLDEDDDDLEDE